MGGTIRNFGTAAALSAGLTFALVAGLGNDNPATAGIATTGIATSRPSGSAPATTVPGTTVPGTTVTGTTVPGTTVPTSSTGALGATSVPRAERVRWDASGWTTSAGSVMLGKALRVKVAVRSTKPVLLQMRRTKQASWTTAATYRSRDGAVVARLRPSASGDWFFRLVREGRATRWVTPRRSVSARSVPTDTWRDTRYAVADIGSCDGGDPAASAALIPSASNVIVMGDLAYPNGTIDDYRNCYLPAYGKFVDSTRPVPGNHDYNSGGDGYFNTFGSRAGTRSAPWYAWNTGSWRFLMINSNCEAVGGCGPGSNQYEWVKAQLRDNPRQCLAAAWHHPLRSSGRHGDDLEMLPMQALLVGKGADFILNGHDHSYERFTRLGSDGLPSTEGAAEFVVGTGGAPLYSFNSPGAGSAVRWNATYGVLRLTLAASGYEWRFLSADGSSVDSGTDTC